jgi:hypothetical protein
MQCGEHFKMEGLPALRELSGKDDCKCIYHDTDSSSFQKIPHFQEQESNLSIPFLSFRFKYGTKSFLKINEIRHQATTTRGHTARILFGWHLPGRKSKGRVIRHDKTDNYTSEVIRIPHQQRENILALFRTQELLGFNFSTKKMINIPSPKITKLPQ